MKNLFSLLFLPVAFAMHASALMIPGTLADSCLEVDLSNIEICETQGNAEPHSTWERSSLTPLIICYPKGAGNEISVPHPGNRETIGVPGAPYLPDATASYSPFTNGESKGVLYLEHADFDVQIILHFERENADGTYSGTAEITWKEAGNTTHMRHATFCTRAIQPADFPLQLPVSPAPIEEATDNHSELQAIFCELQNRQAQNAVEELYLRRLRMLLPLILEQGDVNLTTPETKGNTALHYACGLGHAELVRALVQAGANTQARTDKGATPLDCVSGPQSRLIKTLLK